MRSFHWTTYAAALLTGGLLSAADSLPLPPGEPAPQDVAAGRELFTMNFARPSTEHFPKGLGVNGNGLGPLFNETSCGGCHGQGGVGGSGGLDKNIQMVGIVMTPPPQASVAEILADGKRVHPGFADNSPLKVIQKSAVGSTESVDSYERWRDNLLAAFEGANDSVLPHRVQAGVATIELVQRSTPALWGIGEIEKLRAAGGDDIRRRFAEEITLKRPWITGRPPITPTGEDGWYGWRGQLASLDAIVRSACATEMGIQTPGFDEAHSPVEVAKPTSRTRTKRPGIDLTEEQTLQLTAFVRSMPRPMRQTSQEFNATKAAAGEAVFERVGCADCHAPDLGSVKGMYSDQLLHDMGPEFDDVQAAAPQRRRRTIVTSRPVTATFGGGYPSSPSISVVMQVQTRDVVDVIPTRRSMEWKTPPLWGIRDTYPYLHDGRAPLLKDAIRMHGGEAERSSAEFQKLDDSDKDALISFLQTLAAPPRDEAVVAR